MTLYFNLELRLLSFKKIALVRYYTSLQAGSCLLMTFKEDQLKGHCISFDQRITS